MTIAQMPAQLNFTKPDMVGLAVSVILSCAVVLLTPVAAWAVHWQVLIVAAPLLINFWIWRKESIPPMSIGKAAVQGAIGLLVALAIAGFDTLLGFGFGGGNVVEAFMKSGPAGAPVDLFLAAMLFFVGLPTLARSVFEYYVHK